MDENVQNPEVIETEDHGDGYDLLRDAIAKINNGTATEEDLEEEVDSEESEETETQTESEQTEEEETETEEEETVEEAPEEKPSNRKQSPEEDAKFAEMRRQRQLEERMKETPEYKVAQRLADMYGISVEELQAQVEEAEIAREAEQREVPVELIREQRATQQRMSQMEQELNRLRFNEWNSKVDKQGETLVAKYDGLLSQSDIVQAKEAMLAEFKNPEMSLETAVLAKFGDRILAAQKEAIRNEILAEQAGRKTPTVPKGTKTQNNATVLTADEEAAAKLMGVSPELYAKYK